MVWTQRVAGVLATVALFGVGVAVFNLVRPDDGAAVVASETAATPTATPKQSSKKKSKKAKPLTAREKQARADAVDDVRMQGDTTVREADYDPRARLRVLIGRPVGDSTGGYRAYFFTKDGFVGKDSDFRSTELEVAKQGKATVTLRYGVYKDGDRAGEPTGTKRVRFRLDGTALTALDVVPSADERFQRSSG
ncbi:LppP/LprE family lipoprotein [Solirubrobacter deserti]|uniref:LppP/LprE family lipoprotein n=1 Tax=Solirubrobacter deserti TaxID=2282478 RepID=A0ABT4RH66_9ACTN|nr:LppP/LprE family lipoprotein [Solirubrobacter deserti]MDA0137840.1 LppP/LprE family lipoprotein [Solirubrobacter deserti]